MTQNNAIDNVEVKKSYYESGALWYETSYVDGDIHGIEKLYYESGALEWEIPYVNGEIHGIVRSYEEDKSSIVSLALYEKGHKVASVNLVYKEIAHDTK